MPPKRRYRSLKNVYLNDNADLLINVAKLMKAEEEKRRLEEAKLLMKAEEEKRRLEEVMEMMIKRFKEMNNKKKSGCWS